MRRCVADRVYEGLVTSTLFTALINVSLYVVASYLTGHPVQVLLVLTILSGTVSIYTLNRFTDQDEDRINDPRRSLYLARYGTASLALASALYLASLGVLLFLKVSMFITALLPVIIGLLYSVCGLKRLFILKNIAITAGTICSVLIVLVAFDDLTAFSLLLVVFLSLATLINTIIFDLKDVEGDRCCGVRTVPVIIGVPKTKACCFALLAASVTMIPLLASFTPRSYLLLGLVAYIGVYVAFAGAPDRLPRWYYGLFVDGQALFLAICCGIAIVAGWVL